MVTPDNNAEPPADESLKQTAVRWLFGQEANTIALFLILAGNGYVAWYLINTGVPKHLAMIHSGYKEINDANNKARDEDRQQYDKILDRFEKLHSNHNAN